MIKQLKLVTLIVGLLVVVSAVSGERYPDDDYLDEPYPTASTSGKAGAYNYPPEPLVGYPEPRPPAGPAAYADAKAYAVASSAAPYPPPRYPAQDPALTGQKPSFLRSLKSHVKDLGTVAGHGAKRTLNEAKPALQGVKGDIMGVLHKKKQPSVQAGAYAQVQGPQTHVGLKDKLSKLLHRKPKATGGAAAMASARAEVY